MTVLRLACAMLALSALTAEAHHIWIVPETSDRAARAIFSDTLQPDAPRLLDNIGHTRLWLRDAQGQESPLSWQRQEDSFLIKLRPQGPQAIGGQCIYGTEVHDHRLRQDVQPYLLVYYPKLLLGAPPASKPWPKLTLEIVPVVTAENVRLQVLFKGKPAPRAEMVVFEPGAERANLTSDAQGWTEIPLKTAGVYGFRTRVLQDTEGVHEGKKYWQIRHYASLVLQLSPASRSD